MNRFDSVPIVETLAMLDSSIADLRYVLDRIRGWTGNPSDSIVAAWAPLLLEKLGRVEHQLSECLSRLPTYAPTPSIEALAIRPGMTMAEVEKLTILNTLRHLRGNREQAARALRISPRTLYRKLKEYGLPAC